MSAWRAHEPDRASRTEDGVSEFTPSDLRGAGREVMERAITHAAGSGGASQRLSGPHRCGAHEGPRAAAEDQPDVGPRARIREEIREPWLFPN